MKNLVFLILLLPLGWAQAQPAPVWSSGTPSNYNWYLYIRPKIKPDHSGNIITLSPVLNPTSGKDFLIQKHDASGNLLWSHLVDGGYNQDDEPYDVAVDPFDNIWVVGEIGLTADDKDLICYKYDASGNLKWQFTYGDSSHGYDNARAVVCDSAGNGYLTGMTYLDSLGLSIRMLTMKLDSAGSVAWMDTSANFEGLEGRMIQFINQQIAVVAFNPSGLILFGYRHQTAFFDLNGNLDSNYGGTYQRSASSVCLDAIGNTYLGFGGFDGFKLVRVARQGIGGWTKTIGTNLPSNTTGDEITAITTDAADNVIATGRHYGKNYGTPSYTNADILTVKYSPAGLKIWEARYQYQDSNAADIPETIVTGPNGNFYVAGRSQRYQAGTDYDFVVLKYDSQGQLLGTIRYNDPASGDDVINSIYIESETAIYVAGSTFDSTLSFTTTQKYDGFVPVSADRPIPQAITAEVFPNPATDHFMIRFSNPEGDEFRVRLCNLQGQILNEQFSRGNSLKLQAGELPAGLYLIDLQSAKGQARLKLVRP